MAVVLTIAAPHAVTLTTDVNGNAVGYAAAEQFSATAKLYGEITKVKYTPDATAPFDPGVVFDLTLETSGEPILTATGVGPWYPRTRMVDGGAGSTDPLELAVNAAGDPTYQVCPPIVHGQRVKVTVSGGGALKTGIITVYVG